MWALRLTELVGFVFMAHDESSKSPHGRIRKWDGMTPYGVHPTWCAMTILTETSLPEELRYSGAEALLLHDLLEDTKTPLPKSVNRRVVELVLGMTFESSEQEMRIVWSRGNEILLLKLYDKTSNLLDGVWMTAEKRTKYSDYLLRLCREVEQVYGNLNIIRIARAVC